jgi:hypothetical protein
MTLQVLIGSTPEEVEFLTQLQQLIEWSKNFVDISLGEVYTDPAPFTGEQLDRLADWISGIHMLLTDVNVFGIDLDSELPA